jgi:cation diffusion facilitator family transporter
VIAALLANLGIAVAKLGGFLISGASSMLAEAIHSVADSGNQVLLLVGRRRARRDADEAHPFGHGANSYFYAFLVAVVLFTLGSLFALYEGVEKLRHPHGLESPLVAVAILLVAIGLEGFSLRTAVREAGPLRGDLGWWAYIHRSKQPEITVVLLEDCAALLGLVFALAGVGLAELTANSAFDALGSLAIGLLLVLLTDRLVIDPAWRLLLVVGFLGGYTTFSSYTFEALSLLEEGDWLAAVGYVLGSNGLGLLAAYAGIVLARVIRR